MKWVKCVVCKNKPGMVWDYKLQRYVTCIACKGLGGKWVDD